MKIIIALDNRVTSALRFEPAVQIEHGTQYRACCGLVINKYDTGNVLLQGKLRPEFDGVKEEIYAALKKALPPQTRWCLADNKTAKHNLSLEDVFCGA